MAEMVRMPKLGFDMAEGTLVRWIKAEGEAVARGEVLAEIETDKATVEVEAAFSGVVARQLVDKGAVVPVGTPIALIAAPGEAVAPTEALKGVAELATPALTAAHALAPVPELPSVGGPVESGKGERVKASPLAKRMVVEHQLSLGELQGSGPGGRVVKRDVEAALARSLPLGDEKALSTEDTRDTLIPIDRLRSAIGRRMVESKQNLPHFYVTHAVDMAAAMRLRQELNAVLPEEERLSVNDLIVKATALALRQFPNLNATIDASHIIRRGRIAVGVAVALEGGLMTVVVRDADEKPLRVISGEVKAMSTRARQGKVRPEDIEGSTFSISNLGMFNVEHFAAIINPPEAAILAVASVAQVPVVVDGRLEVGTRMQVTLSADHRVTDGAEAARFLQAFGALLEQPLKLVV